MSPDRIDLILEIILDQASSRSSLSPRQRSALEGFSRTLSAASIDARKLGTGFMMIDQDGKASRLDPNDVMRRQDQSRYKRV
jgi:hypothetical protein